MKKTLRAIFLLAATAAVAFSCAKADGYLKGDPRAYSEDGPAGDYGEASGASEGEGNGNTSAGMLTAGEWRDLDNWDFWGNLMLSQDPEDGGYSEYNSHWGFFTSNRIAVSVKTADGDPLSEIAVALKSEGKVVWNARTDNKGRANCWLYLFEDNEKADAEKLVLVIDGKDQDSPVQITKWSTNPVAVNEFVIAPKDVTNDVDIAFIIDATGSMGDEIDFLKSDLVDIINKVGKKATRNIRTAALMYRDEDDEYLTRASDFADVGTTAKFISKQSADGGGDYPEAVHTALEKTLQDLSWNENAYTRIAFMVLDAPAHYNTKVIESLHTQIQAFARAGIRIIPVAASGVNKETEFMLRYFAIVTGGTYTFLTDDSGIGGGHIAPSVGEYEVEQLNELIVRLILEFIE